MAIPRYRLAVPPPVNTPRVSSRRSSLEIPPNQTSIARSSVRRQAGGTPLNWGRMWQWLGMRREAVTDTQTVEAAFSGDKIP
ncbi:hypothetical protein ACF3M1_16890 [Luteimonas sp. WGS1318]|uniref:hypothetical protein n=1 Tax=Luteimonas sp. WGS1318 TaxID=3366815 RepID=UPI00372D1D32